MNRFIFFCLKWSIFCTLIVGVVISAAVYYYSHDLPDYSQLAKYNPPSVTRIYSADGKLMEEYASEHRVFIPISSIPHSLIEAFIAAEDKHFYQHQGLDFIGIIRAAISNINNILHGRRLEGASTITQQVVKNFLLSSERSLGRKIKEAILSYMVSQVYTKERILELYLNQIYLGRGAYGVAAAAQNYFNKSIDELTLAESAFIAGLPQAPSNFNPQKQYAKSKERRDYVLTRMLDDNYITQDVAQEAIATPIVLHKRDSTEVVSADYYSEQVREEVINMIGKDNFYQGGFTIITSLDANMQNAARNALIEGIRDYDRKRGFKGAIKNIDISDWHSTLEALAKTISTLEYKLAVVLEVSDTAAKIGLVNGVIAKIPLSEMKWAKPDLKSAKSILKKGDVIVAKNVSGSIYSLQQIPTVNGAIVVMDPSTGQVLASVGGYDFASSKFNRVTQALRQPGSLSKAFVYLAALENGIEPTRIFNDGPISISQGFGMPDWRPKNYKGDFLGDVTMRTGLEKSRNLVTVRVAQAVGLNKVSEVIKRFEINSSPKNVYSMVLGALETTLIKMTNAYAIIANEGRSTKPYFVEVIKDRNGKVIYRRDQRVLSNIKNISDAPDLPAFNNNVITDDASSYQLISMLTGVIERGTAKAAQKLQKIIAGKTGTSNDSKDTWFIGFTPRIIVGTYVGYDQPKSLGKSATGGSVALPIFINFMQVAQKDVASLQFKVPDSVVLQSIDLKTGHLNNGPNSIQEVFKLNRIQHNTAKPLNDGDQIIPKEEELGPKIERNKSNSYVPKEFIY